jgi:hypothetical protein
MRSGRHQPPNHGLAKIQKRRSALLSRGRGYRRCSTSSCCRKQRFYAINRVFDLNIAPMAHSSVETPAPPADRRLAGAIRPRSVNAKGDAGYFCAPQRPFARNARLSLPLRAGKPSYYTKNESELYYALVKSRGATKPTYVDKVFESARDSADAVTGTEFVSLVTNFGKSAGGGQRPCGHRDRLVESAMNLAEAQGRAASTTGLLLDVI